MKTDDILRQFTRETMGASVAHMNDDELDAWMVPFRALVKEPDTIPDFPEWFVKRRNEARAQLLAVLNTRTQR